MMSANEERAEREAAYKDWLMGLKEGDEVAIPSNRGQRAPSILRVLKITPTQIVVKEFALETRYNRFDGRKRGNGYSRLVQVTGDVRAKVKLEENREWLESLAARREYVERIPATVLEAVRKAYTESLELYAAGGH